MIKLQHYYYCGEPLAPTAENIQLVVGDLLRLREYARDLERDVRMYRSALEYYADKGHYRAIKALEIGEPVKMKPGGRPRKDRSK